VKTINESKISVHASKTQLEIIMLSKETRLRKTEPYAFSHMCNLDLKKHESNDMNVKLGLFLGRKGIRRGKGEGNERRVNRINKFYMHV
jgi:hypothetical protein